MIAVLRKQTRSRSPRAKRSFRVQSMRPVMAAAVIALGLVCAAAFTGITVQANALERARDVLNEQIAVEQARNAQLEATVAQKATTDYLIQKAQDYDFVKRGEGLIAVERSGTPPSARIKTVGEQAVSRGGSRSSSERDNAVECISAGWSSGSSSGS